MINLENDSKQIKTVIEKKHYGLQGSVASTTQ